MENCIEIQHLQKNFGTVHAVNDLSLQVKQGELFAFLGINGAGKSTTISMLCGQLRQDAGSVRIQGKDTLEDMPQIRQSLGVVFQHSVLDKQLSVLDNLKTRAALYGITGRAFQKRLIELDKLLELKLLLKRSVGKLSGGQRRRIDIARAIFHQPQLLILDEPTTGLDPQTRKSVWRVIGELRKKKHMTVFLTTHYMEEAADAEHVVILDEGRILAEGTPLELKNDVMPIDDAVEYMKAAAKKSYGKKGDAVVQMNWKAIDAGLDAVHKVEVPASWSNPAADPAPKALKGPEALVKQIRDVMEPISRMDGDSLPVSAFEGNVNGEWEQGASAYEKRGTAVMVPEWNAEKCIQCNQCAFVCSHATIRPFCLTAAEAEAAPASTKLADTKPKASEYKFTMAVSPLDCMGCGECVTVCPTAAIEMKPQESQSEQQAAFDYCVENIRKKDNIPGVVSEVSVKGSQFNQPLLEFSGSCAGCAETSYARLITQLFGEKMFISNATGCSSIWGGTASISPYTTNKASGHGPAWINSLFEDNAEHGLGMQIGYETVRENLITKVEALKGKNAELDAVIDKFLETKNNTKANDEPAKALIAALEACGCDESKEILKDKQYLAKKSFWIFGGDGWAYDIGYGGLDHVLASGHDVNVMVFDTEMYSNTGGQASKASNIGEVCQFAAAGKEISKKSLAEICMTYGYIYVAQIALGANMAQAVKVIAEAEAYPGPSLIIGYAPCELHGVKGGMTNCQNEMKKAVAAGYWNLFSFNPAAKAEGKNPFTLTSKAGDMSKYQEFLANETRYSRLARAFPDRAKELFEKNQEVADARYTHLTKLVDLYK